MFRRKVFKNVLNTKDCRKIKAQNAWGRKRIDL